MSLLGRSSAAFPRFLLGSAAAAAPAALTLLSRLRPGPICPGLPCLAVVVDDPGVPAFPDPTERPPSTPRRSPLPLLPPLLLPAIISSSSARSAAVPASSALQASSSSVSVPPASAVTLVAAAAARVPCMSRFPSLPSRHAARRAVSKTAQHAETHPRPKPAVNSRRSKSGSAPDEVDLAGPSACPASRAELCGSAGLAAVSSRSLPWQRAVLGLHRCQALLHRSSTLGRREGLVAKGL